MSGPVQLLTCTDRLILSATKPRATLISRLIDEAAEATGFSVSQILGEGRSKPLCYVRYVIWRRARALGQTLSAIGEPFGRDHSTILNGVRRIEELEAGYVDGRVNNGRNPPYRGVSAPHVAEYEKGNPDRSLATEPRGVPSQQVPVASRLRAHRESR